MPPSYRKYQTKNKPVPRRSDDRAMLFFFFLKFSKNETWLDRFIVPKTTTKDINFTKIVGTVRLSIYKKFSFQGIR